MQVFLNSIQKFFEERPSDVGSAVFDKDDDLAVDIVTSASNLRAICYDIPIQSVFDAKVNFLKHGDPTRNMQANLEHILLDNLCMQS